MSTTDIAEAAIIPAPPQKVWDMTAATDRYAEWVDACVEVTDHHGEATVGRTYSERNRLLGPLKARSTWTVVEADAPRLRRDTGTGFPLLRDLESIFELRPHTTEDGVEQTELTYRVRYRIGLGPLGRLIDRLQQPGMRGGMRRSLQALAELAPASSSSG